MENEHRKKMKKEKRTRKRNLKPITDVASTPLGRNERWYTVSLFESNRLKE
jgi:hypothetical protein